MGGRIIIDGNAFYEIDEACMKKKQQWMEEKSSQKKKEREPGKIKERKNRTS